MAEFVWIFFIGESEVLTEFYLVLLLDLSSNLAVLPKADGLYFCSIN